MEILFLLAGLAASAVGMALIVSEARGRQGAVPVQARVVGFSLGKSNNSNAPFHSVAEYIGQDGRKYYIEGAVGSSVPLHSLGQEVTVLTDPNEPQKAVLKSALSFILGGVLVLMGFIFIWVFWTTFRPNWYSALMAVLVTGGLAVKIARAWRKQPLSMDAWRTYRRSISPKVFTDESKDQIAWADPARLASAISAYRKTNRFAAPVLVALGVGLLLLSYYVYGKTSTFLGKASPAAGIVVGLEERDSTDGDTTYAAVVEYRDRLGRNFKFVDSISSSPAAYHAGQTVNVLYDPDNPSDAQIDRGLGNYWLTMITGFGGALFLIGGVHSARRRLNESATSRMSHFPSPVGRTLDGP